MYNRIDNSKYHVPIEKEEIYKDIFEYIIPEDYYFESCGTSYGNRIYTGKIPSNYYVIKKRQKKDENNTDANSK